jgi:hypothetical protein
MVNLSESTSKLQLSGSFVVSGSIPPHLYGIRWQEHLPTASLIAQEARLQSGLRFMKLPRSCLSIVNYSAKNNAGTLPCPPCS